SVQIVHADILKVDLNALFSAPSVPRSPAPPLKILGNLPYSITSPIFEKLMSWPSWKTAVFLIQREVAMRIAARPRSPDYVILTLAVQLFADPELILQVKPGPFLPPPQVTPSSIPLRLKKYPLPAPEEFPDFFN